MALNSLNKPAGVTKSLMFLLFFLVVLLVSQPFLWGKVKERALVLQESRTLTEQIREMELKIRDIRSNYEQQSTYLNQLAAVIPKSRDALQVIERLETAAQGLDVKVEVSRIDEGTSLKSVMGQSLQAKIAANAGNDAQEILASDSVTSKIFPLHITLMATGPPEALVEYIDTVEHVQELSTIQKFTISPAVQKASKGQEVSQGHFQLLMTTIFYLQDEGDGTSK